MFLSNMLAFLLYATSNRKGGPGEYRVHNDPVQVKRSDSTSGLYTVDGVYNIKNAIRFRLWTRENPILAQEIIVHSMSSLRSSNYNPKRLTKIFVHGLDHRGNEERLDPETVYMRDAYLRFADVNYILVDWTNMAKTVRYATNYGDFTRDRIVEFLWFMQRRAELSFEKVHLIGLSWGAQISGNVGRILGGKLGRITGLDPAGPFYQGQSENRILDKSDAGFVDVIHTDAGDALGLHSGIVNTVAHADFFPNGGDQQPGCPPLHYRYYRVLPCSHERSVFLFVESIGSPLSFPSCQAESWDKYRNAQICQGNMTFMGEHVPHTARGVYFLKTGGQMPFGLGPKLDIVLPSIPGARQNRAFTFDFNRFRFSRLQSQREDNTMLSESGTPLTKTESSYSPSNNTNFESYPDFSPYTPDKYPNNDVLIHAMKLALKRL